MQKKQPAARRIKLRYDFLKAERMEKTVNDFTEFTNSRVIPLMEALGLEVTKESVLKYADNSDLMRFDYIQKEVKTSGIDNKYLLNMVEDTARRKFVELFDKEPYDDRSTRYSDLIKLSEGKLIIDDEALRESATVYVEDPAELEAYDRHMKAVEALNEFFNGKAPEGGLLFQNYFPVVDGVVKPGTTMVSYQQFIKH